MSFIGGFMNLSREELQQEEAYLKACLQELDEQIKELKSNLIVEEQEIKDFNKYLWNERGNMDPVEIRSGMLESDLEIQEFERKSKYLKKLLRIKNSPYFGRIDFNSDQEYQVYIGITHLTKNLKNLIYDWRSPIASLFYDSNIGHTSYLAPEGKISGYLSKKRQYRIEERKIKAIFDNNLNVTDELLQQVLANNSTEKMKNIVNTIQEEQNEIIRNIKDKYLIIQGIAGSGKTSVALHRIAFLLYKIDKLTSEDVLIFSPNNIFSSYISNVLPELGEDNTKETTFSDFAIKYVSEFKSIESFTSFIARSFQKRDNEHDYNLIKFKLSDDFIKIIEDYAKEIERNSKFLQDLIYEERTVFKEDLNELIHDRYSRLTLYERIPQISEHLCHKFGLKVTQHARSIESRLYRISNISKDFIKIYQNLYQSASFKSNYGVIRSDQLPQSDNILNYEDSLAFIYLKGLLTGFPYSNQIKEIVVDEAQDYSKLQYLILKTIFKRATFTILGDINQTINPYYQYRSLEELSSIFSNAKYLELTKTYRSSEEIIKFSNRILDLDYAVSVRKSNNVPVKERVSQNIISDLVVDLTKGLNKYRKMAIITKSMDEANYLYKSLKFSFKDLSLATETNYTNTNLVILPIYLAKGLEFDQVIIYTDHNNKYTDREKKLYYVAATRAQHELIVYNQ